MVMEVERTARRVLEVEFNGGLNTDYSTIEEGLINEPTFAALIPVPDGYKRYILEIDHLGLLDGDFLRMQTGFDDEDPLAFEQGVKAYQYQGYYYFGSGTGSSFGTPFGPTNGDYGIKVTTPINNAPSTRGVIRWSNQKDAAGPTVFECSFSGWRGFLNTQFTTGVCHGQTARVANLKIFCEYSTIRHLRYSLLGKR